MEFHIARKVREKYDFRAELFGTTGNVVFHNFHGVRLFAQKINDKIDLIKFPERAIRTGQLNAMGLIDEILHYVVELYRQQTGNEPFRDADVLLRASHGERYEETLLRFVEEFPPSEVYAGELSPSDYLSRSIRGIPNRAVALEEMLLLWLANLNPAFDPFKELFDDSNLRRGSSYKSIVGELATFFKGLALFGPDKQPLVDMLRSPAITHPNSLSEQLRYMRERWGVLLGRYLFQLLSSLDLIREEEKHRLAGPGPTTAYTYSGMDTEHESFSPDREWMPKVVLMAKSTLVWLDQLSRKYDRQIDHIDQIPDEELDLLRDQGFTGLWLIGLWERSPASKRVKQLCGNPEAEASAYSLLSYDIASSLGGWEALQNLRERCWYRGIRLASDMVPNHTGIDSEWIVNRPERFVQLPYPPFPSYTYGGENLSNRPGIGIYLEDHYYDKTDAAVTFKRVDFNTGDTRYIYHGNDGTHMPWNDTAQLNFADPQVREAVIDTILHVARNFPIIRFDAAMTLAKKHIQRLWYPEPGSGGDIPSRSEHSMSREDFERAVPKEFWREVVDRVAAELPDTLLLAEAFWMMEGYFVRTLGMHRVYNSAFMNMLKDQENAKYRSTIKNTLEFDPEILKRFVNFMNNPDEETAAKQFGKGDKYFGVCTMLVTMPGLPMFGHGQIWGFEEKYGMEYRRAHRDETIDEAFVARHEREIFPLMKKRYLFAEVANFHLFDLYAADGSVNEEVFAYSNRAGNEVALVVYNNRYERSAGWINISAAALAKEGSGGKALKQVRLAETLGIHDDGSRFTIFQEL
ncbi:MAG TPA: alpha-amylase family glycosyl hydrolase, partial [Spirochaetia bacterium]|nr:alpha-amylase family glycosyl hydrolase [Spirochaetia bacterium]